GETEAGRTLTGTARPYSGPRPAAASPTLLHRLPRPNRGDLAAASLLLPWRESPTRRSAREPALHTANSSVLLDSRQPSPTGVPVHLAGRSSRGTPANPGTAPQLREAEAADLKPRAYSANHTVSS